MPKLDLVAGGAPAADERFEVAFAVAEGEQRLPLSKAWSIPFESCLQVRDFPSYKGQRHYSGRWWTATTGTLVGCESWVERDTLVLLDFDADVTGDRVPAVLAVLDRRRGQTSLARPGLLRPPRRRVSPCPGRSSGRPDHAA